MNLHPYELFMKIMEWTRRRMIYLIVVILAISVLLTLPPNSVTHECKPTVQTVLGIAPERQDHGIDSGFCDPGYYPELRFGLGDAQGNAYLFLFIVVLPISLLTPVAIILLAPWINKKFGYYGGKKKDPYRMMIASETDKKIKETSERKKRG